MAGTRERIIVATNELFRRHGYNGTTLTQISAASAATIGSIYHFFPGGKEALAVAVVETTGAVYRELFESIVAEADDAVAGYVEFFDGAAAVLEESDFIDPCPIGTIAREVANTSEPLRQAAKTAFDSWIAAARSHLTAAGIPRDVADELATLFVSTVEGSFVLCRTLRTTSPLIAARRHVVALVDGAMTDVTHSRA
jgi:AcrR family transcriptional regulator